MNIQHYVFSTYKQRRVLVDKVTVNYLYESFDEVAKQKGFTIMAHKILADHVHCLIAFDESHRVDYIIRMLKGISSRMFFKYFRTNRFVYRKLWAKSYFSRLVPADQIETVINYINHQVNDQGVDKRCLAIAPTLKASVPDRRIGTDSFTVGCMVPVRKKEPTVLLSGLVGEDYAGD